MGSVGDLHSTCNFLERWSRLKRIPSANRENDTEPSRVRLDSLAVGDVDLWLKHKLRLAAGEQRGARERGAALPHLSLLGVGMGLIWSPPLPVGKFLAFLTEDDMPLVRSNQPWKSMTPISPANNIPAASGFFVCSVDTSSDVSLAQLKRKQKHYSGPRSNVGG